MDQRLTFNFDDVFACGECLSAFLKMRTFVCFIFKRSDLHVDTMALLVKWYMLLISLALLQVECRNVIKSCLTNGDCSTFAQVCYDGHCRTRLEGMPVPVSNEREMGVSTSPIAKPLKEGHLIYISAIAGCAVVFGVALYVICGTCGRMYDRRYVQGKMQLTNDERNAEDTDFDDLLTEFVHQKDVVSETEPEEYIVEQYVVSDFN